MEVPDEPVEEIVVEERLDEGAVDRTLDRVAVEAFPARSADELLRALPGLHQSAHGGRGKAYQVFLRGFDAEHGTAIAVDLEGIPLNEVNNVHGHGYLDLHVIPDDLVRSVSLHAGVPRSADGNFAIVGAASYGLGLEDPGLVLRVGGGTDRSGSAAASFRPRGSAPETFIHAEAEAGEGVGEQRGWRQAKAAAGVGGRLGPDGAGRVFVLAHDGSFESPGTLRGEDVDEEGFYGAYPLSGGGRSRRILGGAVAEVDAASLGGRALAWGGLRCLDLRQNYTGYLRDEVHGDGTRQVQDTVQGGGVLRGTWWLPVDVGEWLLEGGTDVRSDTGPARIERIGGRDERVSIAWRGVQSQLDAGAWTGMRVRPWPPLALDASARADHFRVAVEDPDQREATATQLSPRARLFLEPTSGFELSGGVGRGLVSPEPRAIVEQARAPVTVAQVAEVGTAVAPAEWLRVRGAGFRTDLDDELVFDHTVGAYVSGGTTRRVGVTGVVELTPTPELVVTADLTYADGRFTVTDIPIPFAPRWLSSGSIFVREAAVDEVLLTGGVRAWYLGRRPLPDGFVSVPAVAADLTARAAWRRLSVDLDVDNLFGNRWRDGEFVFPSWWDFTTSRSERPVVHVSAGEPFAARATIGVRLW